MITVLLLSQKCIFTSVTGIGLGIVLASFVAVGFVAPAQALPSFARQTGQPCGTCHTDFPALTPFGRRFKLLGYTTGGGKFRTTPFLGAEISGPRQTSCAVLSKRRIPARTKHGQGLGAAGRDDGHRRLYPHTSAAVPADRALQHQ